MIIALKELIARKCSNFYDFEFSNDMLSEFWTKIWMNFE